MRLCAGLLLLLTLFPLAGMAEVVGMLVNTGTLDQPIPYAFYTGIAADARGRLYLAGAAEGVPVCDQDGNCLAVIPPPTDKGMQINSLLARAGDAVFCVAQQAGQRSALFRIDTAPADASALRLELVAAGPGLWTLSPTLDKQGRVIVGQSEADKLKYAVTAYAPATGQPTILFTLDQPKGASRPWRHMIQVEPDNTISITHAGGVNWSGRYTATGERQGEALSGQVIDTYRYIFNYQGGVRRTDFDGKAAPGDCGSGLPEIRMAAQMVHLGERYFFVGRGGAMEAKWNGTNFLYTRRIGASYLEDMVVSDGAVQGVAFTTAGNVDVQHAIQIPTNQPICELLHADSPIHGKLVQALAPALYGLVYVYRTAKGVGVYYDGAAHLAYDLALPEVKEIGQAAALEKDLLLADPKSGIIWRRPLLDKQVPVQPFATLPGVIGLATNPEAIFAATATQVFRLTKDGQTVTWTAPETYQGIRRLSATPDYLYVCDTAGNIVDQLDARTGQRLAREGMPGQAGAGATRLNRPYAIAADLNGVYIADNGNGRVLVATTTLWRPQISRQPREDTSPIVAAKLPVKAPKAGRMSVNIYDKNDVTVRQLVCAQPSDAPVLWDGNNMYGEWATPGTYKYHGIIAPKFGLKYVTSIGQSGNPPYRTADGKGSWGGVWGNVMDVCPVTEAPDSDILVLWAFEEGEGGLIRMSQDGAVRWKCHLDWWMKARQMAIASDGTNAYIACSSAMNAPTGQDKYEGDMNRPMIWRVDVATGAKKLYAPATQQQPMFGEYREGKRIVTDIAVRDGKLYLTAPAMNTLYIADAATGKEVGALKIDNVSGVTFNAAGELLVGSGNEVIALDLTGTARKTILKTGAEIWDIDGPVNGKIAISLGAPRHQVIYGVDNAALGKAGGRPLCGKMQPMNFLNPVGLCVLGNGKLFVAENATPRRFTRWSADGKLEQEFHGPYYYSGMFGVDDEHPEYVYGDTHGDIIRYTVDYTTGKWEVDRYWINAYQETGVPAKWWPRIRHRDGKTYWCSGSGAIVELTDDRARGVAAVYGGYVEKLPDGTIEPRFNTKKTGLMGTWSDLNGDGKKQPEEWLITDKPAYPLTGGGPQQGWGCYFDEQFNLYMHDWSDGDAGGVWMLPVVEWKNGTPIYRWEQAKHVGRNRTGHGLAHGSPGARTAYAYGDSVYAFNGGYNAVDLPGVGHGRDWEFAQITQYDPATGQPRWHAGQRTAGFAAPGDHYCPTGPAGVLNDYLFWTDENSLVHVWDVKHGLYVDTLLDDIMRDPVPSAYTVWVELFNTRIFRHPQTGKVYLMAASDAIHIYEVTGTEQKPVYFDGQFTLTAEGLAQAQQKLASRTVEKERAMEIRRTTRPVSIDGDLAEFTLAPTAVLALKPTAQAVARLLYDDTNLYLGFDVKDESPWKNAGGDMTTLFKTGDTIDLWVGPNNAKRAPGLGDVRVLFAPGKDGVTAIAYRPKVAQGAKPVPFRSPAGQVMMDRVEVLATVTAAVKVTADGYRLEAAIPRSELNLAPEVTRFGLDLSVNFSDPAGQRNTARLHWARNGAAIVYDIPTEARLEPATWGIGLFK